MRLSNINYKQSVSHSPKETVWYLQAGEEVDGHFFYHSQASGVLITMRKKDESEPLKLIVTVQHAIRSETNHGLGTYKGPFWTHYRGWPSNTKLTAPEDAVPLTLYAPLNPDAGKVFDESKDFAFLQFAEPRGGWSSASPQLDQTWQDGQPDLTIVGYPGGDVIPRFLENRVSPTAHEEWGYRDLVGADQTGVLTDGKSAPLPGASGGGVFHDGFLIGIYRGALQSQHLFVPITRICEWCAAAEIPHRLVEFPQYGQILTPALDPNLRPLEEALGKSAFAKDESQLARLIRHLPAGDILVNLVTPQEKIRRLIDLSRVNGPTFFSMLLDRVRQLGLGAPDPQVYVQLDKLFPRCIGWRDLNELKARLQQLGVFKNLDDKHVARLLREAADVWEGWRPGYLNPKDPEGLEWELSLCLDHLASAPLRSSGEVLLVTFLSRCREDFKMPKEEVETWARRWDSMLIDRAGPATKREAEAILQILFVPNAAGNTFRLEAFVEEAASVTPFDFPLEATEKEFFAERVAALVDSAMAKLRPEGRTLGSVELFLPWQLLNEPLETAERRVGRVSRQPIGHIWPVVVRSYDRLGREGDWYNEYRPKWLEKWQKLHATIPPVHRLPWACDKPMPLQSFVDLFSGSPLGFMVLWPIPKGLPDVNLDGFIDAALVGGLPLSLWVRNPRGDPEVLRARLDELFRVLPVKDWPDKIRDYRLGECPPMLECDGITLFYDSPMWHGIKSNSVGQMCANQ